MCTSCSFFLSQVKKEKMTTWFYRKPFYWIVKEHWCKKHISTISTLIFDIFQTPFQRFRLFSWVRLGNEYQHQYVKMYKILTWPSSNPYWRARYQFLPWEGLLLDSRRMHLHLVKIWDILIYNSRSYPCYSLCYVN